MYFWALFIPPLAVLLAKKPGQAFFNFLLCLLFYIPGVIHAFFVVHEYKADKRMREQAELIRSAKA